MEVTEMIRKIKGDYVNLEAINRSIRYRFTYNGYQTDVFYTTENELKNQLLLIITVDNIDYLTTLYFSERKKDTFFMNYYLPEELYHLIKFKLLYANGKCATTPFFTAMTQSILNTAPFPINPHADIAERQPHRYQNSEENPFFETMVNHKMSLQMKKKIQKKYDNELANQILKFCGTTKTLRFTSDINRAKDIVAFLNKPTGRSSNI